MYEELVKRLRDISNSDSNIKSNYIGLMMKQAADVIEELSREIDVDNAAMTAMDAAMPRWIPVAELLPEDRRDVLVYAGVMFPYITVGYYDGLWKFSYNDEEITGSADYWMPLPEPPKGEKDCFCKAEEGK